MDEPILLLALGGITRAAAGRWTPARLAYPDARVVWEYRSLESFGDQPLSELAGGYDLVVIDHPQVGEAVTAGCLRPLACSDPGSIGPSHASYGHDRAQWAMATDAACQVAAWHPALTAPPADWDEVLALARARPRRVALPLHPAHALCSLATLCAQQGALPRHARTVPRAP